MQEVLNYYRENTGLNDDLFILNIQKGKAKSNMNIELSYNEWLALNSFKLLETENLTLSDCLDYRNQSTKKQITNNFFLPSIWKKEIGRFINQTLPPTLNIEVSESEESEIDTFDTSKIDLSDKSKFNIFNTFDFGDFNRKFLDNINDKVKKGILEDKKMFFNFNPYLETDIDKSNLIEEMKINGFGDKKYNNSLIYTLFRMIRLKEEYNLKNMYIGFYSDLKLFKDEEYVDFYNVMQKHFKFKKGICFKPIEANVKTKDTFISYTIWESCETSVDNKVILEERIRHTQEEILQGNRHLIRGKITSLYNWTLNFRPSMENIEVPMLLNVYQPKDIYIKRPTNVIAYSQASENMFKYVKKIGTTNLPMGENIEVGETNLWQVAASTAVRVALEHKVDSTGIYLSSPDTTIKGYLNWLADALILFLFDTSSMMVSYRSADIIIGNNLFPFSKDYINKITNDKRIKNDIKRVDTDNSFILKQIEEAENYLSEEGMALLIYARNKIKVSLQNNVRESIGYKNHLVAWDSSLYQIRSTEGLFSNKDEETYIYLLDRLRNRIYEGLFIFGFIEGL